MILTIHQANVSAKLNKLVLKQGASVDLPTVNDEVEYSKAGYCPDDDLLDDIVGESRYQQEGKASRENYTAVISLLGSFIFMAIVALVASTLFPTPSTQNRNSTNTTVDMTPMLTPMQMMGPN
ncbi:hypothetical protein [Fischerella sp. PCC 9605]|uniref:hypothetical protein n=1 Tax=Fischerella sp. PCC 9605 TaxID=1173024 RepID=UPI0004794B2F|nr:hypothetical protein [Fischerella sp. PCC 9605]